jgi:hypothetical protein
MENSGFTGQNSLLSTLLGTIAEARTTTATGCSDPTKDIVQSTGKFLAPMRTRKVATPNFGM